MKNQPELLFYGLFKKDKIKQAHKPTNNVDGLTVIRYQLFVSYKKEIRCFRKLFISLTLMYYIPL